MPFAECLELLRFWREVPPQRDLLEFIAVQLGYRPRTSRPTDFEQRMAQTNTEPKQLSALPPEVQEFAREVGAVLKR